MSLQGKKIGFLGAGRMGSALAEALVSSSTCSAGDIILSDVYDGALSIAAKAGHKTTKVNKEVVNFSDVVVVAVKPQCVDGVLADIKSAWTPDKVLVSICAGIPTATFTTALGSECRTIRVMPNTPCLVGKGAAALCGGGGATEEDVANICSMFEKVGISHKVSESLLDAVTGLSGSGPAYVYMLIEAMSDAAVREGLPRDVAVSLAAQTVGGAAKMVTSTKMHPAQLKDQVTSPAGTTIAGVGVLEENGFRSAVMSAVRAATRRSAELGGR